MKPLYKGPFGIFSLLFDSLNAFFWSLNSELPKYLISQPLARLGAEVTGVDVSARNIHAALRHASRDPLVANKVQYKCSTVEQLADEEPESFDCVVASEVIEHVTDKDTFISAILELIKVGLWPVVPCLTLVNPFSHLFFCVASVVLH